MKIEMERGEINLRQFCEMKKEEFSEKELWNIFFMMLIICMPLNNGDFFVTDFKLENIVLVRKLNENLKDLHIPYGLKLVDYGSVHRYGEDESF